MTFSGKSVDFSKVISLIEEMVSLLHEEVDMQILTRSQQHQNSLAGAELFLAVRGTRSAGSGHSFRFVS